MKSLIFLVLFSSMFFAALSGRVRSFSLSFVIFTAFWSLPSDSSSEEKGSIKNLVKNTVGGLSGKYNGLSTSALGNPANSKTSGKLNPVDKPSELILIFQSGPLVPAAWLDLFGDWSLPKLTWIWRSSGPYSTSWASWLKFRKSYSVAAVWATN